MNYIWHVIYTMLYYVNEMPNVIINSATRVITTSLLALIVFFFMVFMVISI